MPHVIVTGTGAGPLALPEIRKDLKLRVARSWQILVRSEALSLNVNGKPILAEP